MPRAAETTIYSLLIIFISLSLLTHIHAIVLSCKPTTRPIALLVILSYTIMTREYLTRSKRRKMIYKEREKQNAEIIPLNTDCLSHVLSFLSGNQYGYIARTSKAFKDSYQALHPNDKCTSPKAIVENEGRFQFYREDVQNILDLRLLYQGIVEDKVFVLEPFEHGIRNDPIEERKRIHCRVAAVEGSLNTARWLIDKGLITNEMKQDPEVGNGSVFSNDLEVVKFFFGHGFAFDEEAVLFATKTEMRLPILSYLVDEMNCPFDYHVFFGAIDSQNIMALDLLMHSGRPFDVRLLDALVLEFGGEEITAYFQGFLQNVGIDLEFERQELIIVRRLIEHAINDFFAADE